MVFVYLWGGVCGREEVGAYYWGVIYVGCSYMCGGLGDCVYVCLSFNVNLI